MIAPSQRRNLYELVVEKIGMDVMKGEWKPGDTLPNEDALCRQFQVSRGALREATKVLAQKGLIRSRPKVGTQVRPRREWNLFDADVLLWKLKVGDRLAFLETVTEVRRIIESEAAWLAAQRADAAEIVAVAACYRDLEGILASAADYDYERYLELDMAFHTAILDACHNELLAQIGHTMRQAVQTARRSDIRDLDILRESLPTHLAMATAIAAHDAPGARSAALAMFDQVWAHLPKAAESSKLKAQS